MSAIVGVLHFDGRPASAEVLSAMSAAVAHRGTEAAGVWADGPVALGHRASHTTAESVRERQPLVHQAGLILVADARIDNRAELTRALAPGETPPPGDAELILRAYARWGRECAHRLIGDFAFAVWDQRSQAIFCARDPMGVRPFYFFLSNRLFAFASEIKALFRCPGVPDQIDDEQVALHIAALHDDRTATLYTGISRLPAAQTMVVHRGRSVCETYWRAEVGAEIRYSTDDQYAEAFRELLDTAVRVRLRSNLAVGATLSGGLDSSSVVCMARHARGSDPESPLHAFSLVFPGLPESDLRLIDERAYIESVVRGGGVTPHFIRGDLLRPLDDTRCILWHLDEPFSAPNLYLHWGIYAAARDAGVGILLDGFDGDSVVSHGFGRLNGLMQSGQWSLFEREVRAFASHRGRSPDSVLEHFGLPYLSHLARRGAVREWARAAKELVRRFDLSPRATVWRHGLLPIARPALRLIGRRRVLPLTLLRRQFAVRVERRMQSEAEKSERTSVLGEPEMHAAGLSQPVYQLTLEMADKCSRAFGIEGRYPFFDRRLIDFCLSVPDDKKFAGGWPRALFRRAMEGYLPADIQWRSTKGNLACNFDRGLRTADLQARNGGRLHAQGLARYVDPASLAAIERRYRSEKGQAWRAADAQQLFRVAVMADWLSRSWKHAGPIRDQGDSGTGPEPELAAGGTSGASGRESAECRS
ncbi:MAG: lasso peptide isopeptide bond-forming cyclase [Gemmatimonadaceae bacterium]